MRFLFAAPLAALVSVAPAQTRQHSFDLQNVRWEVVLLPDKGEVRGDVTNRLIPSMAAKSIELDAVRLKISSVEVGKKRVKFRTLGSKLIIDLAKPGDGVTPVDVRIRYSATPEVGMYFVDAARAFPAKTPVVYTQGEMEDNRGWLPTYDYPDDKATSEGIVTVPAGWSVLSNGRLIERRTGGKQETWHWRMDQPHATYLISLVAGPYTELVESRSPIPVSVWVPKGLEEWGKAAFFNTAPIVEFYGRLTGTPYPYAKYAQSAVPEFMFGGMENITSTTQTINAIFPPSAAPVREATGLVAHELAHQWTGDLVTTNGWADAWINEGWASFLPAFWTRESEGQDAYDLARYDTFQGGLGGAAAEPKRTEVDTNYTDPLDMFDGVTYAGGAARMFMLLNLLGEEKFWATCKSYFADRQYTSFDTHAFFETWSRHSGQDLTAFKDQWFFKPSAPRLTVSLDGRDLVITQATPQFKLDLPVWILDGKTWVKKSVHLEGKEARLPLGPLAGLPVLVDPECWLMGWIENKVPLTNAQRIALFKNAPNMGERARILDSMIGELTMTEKIGLAEEVTFDPLLIRFIEKINSPEAIPFFLKQLRHPNLRVVNAAAEGLGRLPKTDATVSALADLYDSSSNDEVKMTAFRSRLRLTNAAALADAAFQKERYDDGYRKLALEWWRDHDADTARVRALEVLKGNFAETTRGTAANVLGKVKDLPGRQDAYRALVKIVHENSFSTRSSAIRALAEYGDKRAIAEIKPLVNHGLIFMRQTAKSAVERLEKKD